MAGPTDENSSLNSQLRTSAGGFLQLDFDKFDISCAFQVELLHAIRNVVCKQVWRSQLSERTCRATGSLSPLAK